MGKQALIKIEYYENNYDLYKIYKTFLSQKSLSYFDVNYYWVDDEPVTFVLNEGQTMSDILLEAISKYQNHSIGFNLIFKNIITYHNLNIADASPITIGIGQPKMIDSLKVPDFSFYAKILLPYFNIFEIEHIEFSYG